MATFKTIADADIASGAALSQSLMQALKDNITACFEGDITSPQLQPDGLGAATTNSDRASNPHFCIASTTGNAVADNNSLLEFRVRKTGSYWLNYVARMGEVNKDSGGGVTLNEATINIRYQKASSGSSSFSDIADTTQTLNIPNNSDAGNTNNVAISKEISLTAGDQIRIKVDETAGLSQLRMTAKVYILGEGSFFSANAIGVMTST